MPNPPCRRPTRRHVILVRAPKLPLDRDPYHLARLALDADSDLQLHHLAILETDFCNQDTLRSAVNALHAEHAPATAAARWDGVVMTSARSVEAFCAAQRDLETSSSTEHDRDRSLPTPAIPFFVVGHPTCTALQRAPCPPRQEQVLGAEQCGTGERLAEYIVQYFSSTVAYDRTETPPSPLRRPRLLYLTGDKNRDTIPRRLAKGGIDLDPLQVYSTRPSPSFPSDLDAVLAEVDASAASTSSDGTDADAQVWFALFSPSGASECLAEMRRRALIPPFSNGTSSTSSVEPSVPSSSPETPAPDYAHLAPRVRFAAIGPVTEQFLREQALPVHAVAHKPEPAALLDAVARAEDGAD
ncbi:hypothetical protein JCM3774_006455 [Rhodotorula dairenensis]